MGLVGHRLVSAAGWARRVRPAWSGVVVVLVVVALVLDLVQLELPPLAQAAIIAVLAFLYPFPLLVTVIQNFRAGLRGNDSTT